MPASVVLAVKCYVVGDARERTLDGLRGLINDRLGDLEADVSIDVREDDFPVVTLDGADAVAARNLLAEEFGEIPVGAGSPAAEESRSTDGDTSAEAAFVAGEAYVGTLESWNDDGFLLDAGRPVRVPPDGIDLGPGDPAQIVERFGLVQHLPMTVTVRGGEGDNGDEAHEGEAGDEADEGDQADEDQHGDATATETDEAGAGDAAAAGHATQAGVERADAAESAPEPPTDDAGALLADLAETERDRLYDWQRGPGRVTVNSATRSEVRATVNRAGHAQDIVTVERLGLLEHSIVCKDGTDPPGLIAAIGEYLPAELRAVV